MPWAAAAAVVAAGIGAYSSDKASKENARGIQKGLNQSAKLAGQARADVISLFDHSARKANMGLTQSLDFYKQNAAKRLQPFVQGNQAAQNVVNLGAQQANNAILGLPVNMNVMNQPQVQADYGGIMGANLPEFGKTFAENEQARLIAEQPQLAIDAAAKAKAAKAKEAEKNDVDYRLDPTNQFKNQAYDIGKAKKFIKKVF